MTGVIGMIDLLLETGLDDRQQDLAQTVQRSGQALMVIVNNLLDFSRIDAGRLDVESIDFAIEPIVDDVLDLLATTAQAKGIELVADIDPTVPATVQGDPGRMRQVLTNLAGNAVKFTTTGDVVVRVRTVDGAPDTCVVRFEVTDTGQGIAAEQLPVIFEPFTQADSSIARRFGGTGLGLAISRQLTTLMGGECGVSSRVGEGSTFWFTIVGPAHPGSRVSVGDTARSGLSGIRVLLVDDNSVVRDVLGRRLAELDILVTVAATVEAALLSLRTAAVVDGPPTIVVLDRNLPGPGGPALLRAIVDEDLDARVVLMEHLGQVPATGGPWAPVVRATVTKPVHRARLRAALGKAAGTTGGTPVGGTGPATSAGSGDPRRSRPPTVPTTPGGRLLLVEDNPINQRVAMAMLSAAGYRVDVVDGGAAAVSAAGLTPYDAILMDCQMPDLDGYQATAAIRSQEGTGRHTPVIAMSAAARRKDREATAGALIDAHVVKPVTSAELLAAVHRVTGHTARRRSTPVPTVDAEVQDNLRSLGRSLGDDLLGQLVEEFVRETDRHLIDLRRACQAGEDGAIARIAGAMRAAAGRLGGTGLVEACAQLEESARSGRSGPDGADPRGAEREYRSLRALLAQYHPLDGTIRG
jgi:CheY-like chemotaxis protein/HPt (histidine-containing phosphotransfer) domain-containing protein